MDLSPVTLTGRIVRLEPLGYQHTTDLLEAAAYDEIWTYLDEPTPRKPADIEASIRNAEKEHADGQRLPFATVDLDSGKAIGSVSLIDIRQRDRSVEVGWAWVTPSKWRTGAAREANYLLMRHAFDTMGAIRVAFETDSRNQRSQKAITWARPRRASSATTASSATGTPATPSTTASSGRCGPPYANTWKVSRPAGCRQCLVSHDG